MEDELLSVGACDGLANHLGFEILGADLLRKMQRLAHHLLDIRGERNLLGFGRLDIHAPKMSFGPNHDLLRSRQKLVIGIPIE